MPGTCTSPIPVRPTLSMPVLGLAPPLPSLPSFASPCLFRLSPCPAIVFESILALLILSVRSVLVILPPSGSADSALLGLASRLTGRDVPSLPLQAPQDAALDHLFLESPQQAIYRFAASKFYSRHVSSPPNQLTDLPPTTQLSNPLAPLRPGAQCL